MSRGSNQLQHPVGFAEIAVKDPQDGSGRRRNRSGTHREFNGSVVAFYKKQLAAR